MRHSPEPQTRRSQVAPWLDVRYRRRQELRIWTMMKIFTDLHGQGLLNDALKLPASDKIHNAQIPSSISAAGPISSLFIHPRHPRHSASI